jgi:predicted alpha/beta hydrolase family esterase
MAVLDRAAPKLDSNTILVGHSTGALLILRKLEKGQTPVSGSFLVSSFVHELGIPQFDEINSSFFRGGFDWPTIKNNAGRAFVYHGDNDPYVPL